MLTTLVKRSARRLLRYAGYDVVRLRTPVRVAPTAPEAKPITETDALALAELRRAFPFPEVEPHIRPFFSSLDGGGRDLVAEVIQERRAKQILEIGAFLGGSAELWLRSWPEAVVICIDHWPDADAARAQGGTSAGDYAARSGYPEAQPQLDRPGGFFQTFLANLIHYKDRVIPVRAESPGVLLRLFLLGARPDVIYIDAGKSYQDLLVSRQLWPSAVLTGDDWNWGADRDYPVRQAVLRIAERDNLVVTHKGETWVLREKKDP